MNAAFSTTKKYRWLTIFWLLLCSGVALFLFTQRHQVQITSSVLDLLPSTSQTPISQDIQNEFIQRMDRQIIWLIQPQSPESTEEVDWWTTQIQNNSNFAIRGSLSPEDLSAFGKFYFQNRLGMMEPSTQKLLQQPEQYQQWVIGQVYSPFAGVSRPEVEADPLLLTRHSQLARKTGALTLEHGRLVANDSETGRWYFLHAELQTSQLTVQPNSEIMQQLQLLQQQFQEKWPKAKILTRGTILYSHFASQQAHHDATALGSITILGVLVLIYCAFRSVLPLALTLLSIAIGGLFGFSAVLFFFGEIHLLTLVMCISLIGVSADYTLYYLAERMVHGSDVSPFESLSKIRSALLWALSSTVLAYLVIVFAPFPGLQQLAVFAIFGLSSACLTVIFCYPFWVNRLPPRPIPFGSLLKFWLNLYQHSVQRKVFILIGMTCLIGIGIARVEVNDDISHLQALPQHLLENDQAIARITGQNLEQKGFLIVTPSAQTTLETLEELRPILMQAQVKGLLKDFKSIPLNSLKQQQLNLAQIEKILPQISLQLTELGFPIHPTPLAFLTPEAWENSPTSEGLRLLWLCTKSKECATFVPLEGIQDPAALRALAAPLQNVYYIDKKEDFNQVFSYYRAMLSGLLVVAVVLIAFLFCLRFGINQAFWAILPCLASIGMGIAVLGYVGFVFNLFTLLALILILGMGINYILLFKNPQGTQLTALWGIILAMCTTMLTLGVLVFSSTTAIRSFGLVLSVGIFTAFLLAPLASTRPRKPL